MSRYDRIARRLEADADQREAERAYDSRGVRRLMEEALERTWSADKAWDYVMDRVDDFVALSDGAKEKLADMVYNGLT